jgi:starch synthase
VLSYNEFTGAGNGFTFLNYNAHDMLHVVERAVKIFREHKDAWDALVRRAMAGRYGWDQSARKYVDLYRALCAPAKAAPPAKVEAKPAEQADEAEDHSKKDDTKAVGKPRAKKAGAGDPVGAASDVPPKEPRARKAANPDAPKKPRAPRKKADA